MTALPPKLDRMNWSEFLEGVGVWIDTPMIERFRGQLLAGRDCMVHQIGCMMEWDRKTIPPLEIVFYDEGDDIRHWGIAHPWPTETKPRRKPYPSPPLVIA